MNAAQEIDALLFESVSALPCQGKASANLIGRLGRQLVPWSGEVSLDREGIRALILDRSKEQGDESILLKAANCFGLESLEDLMFVSNDLPNTANLFWLRDQGVRTFVFRELMQNARYGTQISAKIFMDGYLHQAIHELSRTGVNFVQLIELPSRELQARVFSNGFWCLPEARRRAGRITTFVNMYGWARDELLPHSEKEVEVLFLKLREFVGQEHLGVMHGKGAGYMGLSDRLARKLSIASVGVGIDLEKIGEIPNFEADLALDFWSEERAYRQKIMDQLGLLKIFNIGGYGTLEEVAITLSSYKLLESFPAPVVLVDESASKVFRYDRGTPLTTSQHLWSRLKEHIENISCISQFTYPTGRSIDVSRTPLGPRWMKNVVHLVSSYAEATHVLLNFLRHPETYWKSIEISPAELEVCSQNYRARLQNYGFVPPSFLGI
ncbi:hypothetical protein BRAO375_3550002 [Bradyrhizobium sp. ORS 375]|uniref:hypothetical protein n=1 Tax=Bradyrhizobium sp. (strain ORS 375) TaxID=566679 RepID=UPI0002405E3A|nr:hypothetical protein [Bradyrhizobium sp. ORS 375]CCD94416.1 hypothetical protein BRAO375_3550002 [Bradyrhizobium sp. ORS 375]